jgi:phosphoribosylaminoimidazolecarboxamide formyltransferase/IMP cyclohydrolase
MKVRTALISVSDKSGVEEFAKGLAEAGVKVISTGGTARKISGAGVKVTEIEELTGFPECLDGRVKTLHPKVHAGILAERGKKSHMEKLKELGIEPVDLVVVNLYPFKETISKEGVKIEDAVENIDIGGPTMVRAAAKNYKDVAVVVNPARYGSVISEIKESGGLGEETRKVLCKEAFEHTAAYDSLVSSYLRERFSDESFPDELSLGYEKMYGTRYGENPHQKGAFYKEPLAGDNSIVNAEQLNGKEMSFNNIYDANAALATVQEFEEPCVAIVKHSNPCGVAADSKISEAFRKALDCDPVSAFGGVIALNRECDSGTAKQITAFFNEIVVAPSFSEEALAELKKKNNLRVLRLNGLRTKNKGREFDIKKINGGIIMQEKDTLVLEEKDVKVMGSKKPDKREMKDLLFAWKVVKHVRSNAIVLAKDGATTGIGAGQMSRVSSAEIAVRQAGEKAKGGVMASDAFFPFRDSVDMAAKAGISAVIETGGSLRDEEVIKAADEKGITLIFSGVRHFKH